MRNELTDLEWSAIKPFLPNKPRGVPRVNDRRVLYGIFWVLRSGAPWRDLPQAFGPCTSYNRFVRGRLGADHECTGKCHDAVVQMIDTSIVRVHSTPLASPAIEVKPWPVSRRVDHQDSCSGRYERPACPARVDGW